MEELAARAALVPAAQVAGGLTTTIARSDVEKALSADEPPPLIVDITRKPEAAEAAEKHSVAISWQRTELEELLGQASGGTIQLTFDAAALEQALSADVEAHGLREKVLVLAVAATAAAGGAATAAAQPVDYSDSGTVITAGQVQQSVSPDDRAVSFGASGAAAASVSPDDRAVSLGGPATPAPSVSPDDRAVPFGGVDTPVASVSPDDRAVPFTGLEAPGLSPDDRAVPFAAPGAPAGSLSPDDRAVPFTAPDAPVASVSPDDRAVPFSGLEAPVASVSPDDRAVPFAAPDAPAVGLSPDDRAVPRSATPDVSPTTGDDGGITISAPSPEAIAVGGAVLLAITGAAFAFAGTRRVRSI